MRAIRTPSEDNFRRNEEMERGNHHSQYQPPMNQHSIDQRTHHMLHAASTINPFHSPYIDPVGSIIGLRVLYIDGRMCYVPVEPQLNFMINQHFGRIGNEQSGEERLQPRSIIQELQSGVSSLSGDPETMDDPPWARPHPQPANGKRGTAAWRNEFPRKSSMNRQPPGGFTSDLFGTGLTSASTNNYHASRRPQQANVYEPPPAPENRTRNPPRERSIPQQQEEEYNPWGRGGGGAPLRDGQGNIVADRRRLGASWSRSVDTNETHHLEKDRSGNYLMHSRQAFAYQDPYRKQSPDYHQSSTNHQPFSFLPPLYPPSHYEYPDEYANRRGGGGSSMAYATSMPSLASKANLSPADQHREELQRQIDDNRRRKEAERLKEIEMEKKEIQRDRKGARTPSAPSRVTSASGDSEDFDSEVIAANRIVPQIQCDNIQQGEEVLFKPQFNKQEPRQEKRKPSRLWVEWISSITSSSFLDLIFITADHNIDSSQFRYELSCVHC
ncbi:hypothetical protein PRIPAC_96557 [Pristionchus pacificus]|uniref:Uncharacterized protein n=1 Tax=Pristionchus pacificus TaxID=54126 RepID=A0A2A6D0N0_PRIPA|nr:hypothetical protein PRIPAC_96557 [Pristionchus pacificus]|eukprot:PDM83965.1 hypothetical protein PRIPAC_34157 [Pristionchus pacificus]